MNDRWQKNGEQIGAVGPFGDELQVLCQRVCEELLTAEEGVRLEELLIRNPNARNYYLEFVELHGALQWGATVERNISTAPPAPPAPTSATTELPATTGDGLGLVSSSGDSSQSVLASAPDPKSSGRSSWWCSALSKPRFSLAMSIAVLLLAFSVVAAGERIIRAVFSHSIEAHPSGGLVRNNNKFQVGGSHRGTRRVGSSHVADMGLVNILVFRLPSLREFDKVKSARLEWTYKERQGSPDFSVDLYGLGYVRSTSDLGGCFWEGQLDAKRRTDYGMEGSRTRPVSLIAKAAMSPQTDLGRIVVEGPKLTAFLQSLYNDGAKGGELAVFRLNADVPTSQIARLQAYEVVHPPEVSGLTATAEFPSLQLTADPMMAGSPTVAEVVMTAHGIEASGAATLVYSSGKRNAGASERGTRRIGKSATSNESLANLLTFRLPPLREFERVKAAQLEWTYKSRDGNPHFSVDLYGLGSTPSIASLGTCFWEGAYDTHLRGEYGMNNHNQRQVALIRKSAMTPKTRLGKVTVEGPELVDFLQSLYDDGAGGGDWVVFRLNADSSTGEIDRATAYQVVHPPEVQGKTTTEETATLHLISY